MLFSSGLRQRPFEWRDAVLPALRARPSSGPVGALAGLVGSFLLQALSLLLVGLGSMTLVTHTCTLRRAAVRYASPRSARAGRLIQPGWLRVRHSPLTRDEARRKEAGVGGSHHRIRTHRAGPGQFCLCSISLRNGSRSGACPMLGTAGSARSHGYRSMRPTTAPRSVAAVRSVHGRSSRVADAADDILDLEGVTSEDR